MGGSSNTSGGGGAGGKDKEDKGKGSSVSFTEGEKVLAYHGPLLYEAKVQKTENREGERWYFVHYLGWNKNFAFHFLKFEDCGNEGSLDRLRSVWFVLCLYGHLNELIQLFEWLVFNGYRCDEWVASDRLLKLTEENVRKQLELKNQSWDKTIKTGGRSAQHNPEGSNG
ncbi:uncharacterized protein [Aegilops tauschii subsp. strangulata]|uniref:uncharacterized protein n=1 Tax=Aegilops tauschii subsp. strangulata TaxID=200361 RepID=UPI000989BB8E